MPQQFQFFIGKATDIIRVLLVNYPKTWTIRSLAKESQVSLGWTSKVCNELIKEKYAIREARNDELKLMAPQMLLKKWAWFNDFSRNSDFIEYYSPDQEISNFFSRLKTLSGSQYAITLIAGSLMVAPFVRATDIYLYVQTESDARMLGNKLHLMPVEKMGNVHFAIPEDKGVFYGGQDIEGITVVSDIQLYVDLVNYQGRGIEAADKILSVIERRWRKLEEDDVRQRNH